MPISYQSAEECTLEIIDILGDNMPAKLDALEAEYTGELALTLEDIKKFYFGDSAKPPIQNAPCVLVIPDSYDQIPRGMANINADNISIAIKVIIFEDPNLKMTIAGRGYSVEEVMSIKIIRYLRAIREILNTIASRQLNNKIDRLDIGRVTLQKVEVYENVLMKSGQVEVICYGKARAE